MKKLFISQPMRGKTDEEILAERKKAIESAERNLGEPVEVIDSFFQNAPADARPLWFLGKSLSCCLQLILHTSPKDGKMQEAVELKTSALSSTALRLSRITQRSREEVILLSPSHGLNDRLIQAFCLV